MSPELFISETVKFILVAIPILNELTHEPFFKKYRVRDISDIFSKKRLESPTLSRKKVVRLKSMENPKSEIPKSEIRKSRKISKRKCSYREGKFLSERARA